MTATPEMAEYCLKVIAQRANSSDKSAPIPLPPLPSEEYACFVTLTTLPNDDLRGCIGSLSPGDLRKDMPRLAISAAFQDNRFPPVTARELPKLRCTFSLLHSFEPCKTWNDWTIGTHGIIAEYHNHSATYLPSVMEEQGWDHKETLMNLLAKAGLRRAAEEDLAKVSVTRYQVSKRSRDYKDMIQ